MAKNNEAKVKFTADTEQFNESLKQVSYNTKELKSEMKLIEAQMKHGGATIDNLQSKHDNLSAQLKENENLQEALNNKLEVAVKYFDENSTEAQNLRIQLNNARIAHEKLEAAVNASSQQIDEFRAATTDTRTAGEKLTDTINEQQSELDRLKSQYRDVILEQDEGSEAARELERKISDLNGELEDNKRKLKDADDATDKLTGSLEDSSGAAGGAGDGFTTFKGIVADLASNAIQWAIGAISDFVSSLWGLAEETREFRQDMGTLETAFDNVGFSTEQATDTWKELYSVFGEDDRAVEAANNISRMAKSEEELNQWTDILTGAWGVYQDALPVESLAESAGETAKVGTVTGALADALNWSSEAAVMFAGYMGGDVVTAEDAFNVALSECTTEQERQALITDTLTALYGDAADKYEETSSALMEYNESSAEVQLAQAGLAETIQPLNTLWNETKAQLIEAVTPALKEVSDAIIDVTKWLKENESVAYAIATALGILAIAVTGLSIGWGIYTIAQSAAATALWAFLAPILPIVAGIAALVAAFVILWNECEGFRNFFINAWQTIKTVWAEVQPFFEVLWFAVKQAFAVAIDFIVARFQIAWEGIKVAWSVAVSYFQMIWANIQQIFSVVQTFFVGAFQTAWTGIQLVWAVVGGFFANVWNTIQGIFAVVQAVLSGDFQGAWTAIKGIVSGWAGYFSGVWSSIKAVFSSVKSWFSSTFQAAINAVKNIWSNIGTFFGNAVSEIRSAIVKVKEIISKPFEGAKEAVMKVVDKIVSTFNNMKISFPKIKLPHFSITGSFSLDPPSIPKIGVEWYAKGGILTRPTVFGMNGNSLMVGGEAGAEAIAPIDKLQGYIEEAVNASYANYNIASLVAAVEDLADRAIQLNINGREFATATAGDTDSVNGRRVGLKTRGLATT